MSNEINLVSIGANCLPKVVLTRWGLIPKGSATLPLDLCLSSDDGALTALAENFMGLTEPSGLSWEDSPGCPHHDLWDISFCHEVGEEWRAQKYAALANRYRNRIQNFDNVLLSGRGTVFVYCSHTAFTANTSRLLLHAADALAKRCLGPVQILGVLTGSAPEDLVQTDLVSLLRLPLPRAGYLFHQPEDYGSEAGVAFEREIVTAVSELTQKLTTASASAAFAS